ncbi:MAG: hypothetical protein ACOX42_06780 [Clostridia bacterium]|jgi:hypothetical protein|nr:hypothetical protein [Clostridiales bacterium]
MRAVKVVLTIFFMTAIVTGYIIYDSGMSVSISVKPPSGDNTGEQSRLTGATDRVGANGTINPAGPQGALTPEGAGEAEYADIPVEQRIYDLFKSIDGDDEEGFNELLNLLPGIDWALYEKKHGDAEDGTSGTMELLEWLTDNPFTTRGENMYKIFQATKGLDGAFADQYSMLVGSFFRSDGKRFVRLLARLDEKSIDEVCRMTAYNNYFHVEPEEAVESTTALFESKELSASERYVVDAVVKAIGAYITEEST